MPTPDSIPVLLAADVWEIAVGAIFFILYAVGQLVSAREKAQKKAPRPRRAPPDKVPQVAAPADKPLAQNQEEKLRNEVEQFLRRAEGKSAEPPKPPSQPTPVPTPLHKKSRRPAAAQQSQRLPSQRPIEPLARSKREGVAEHVSRHLDPSELVAHAERLGGEVGQSDERMESRLQEKFDHRLGSLQHEDRPAEKEKQKANIAADIAAMLRSPEGMRQLIIAQEILRRPERW